MSPASATIEKSPDLSHDVQKSFKNPKPGRRSNSNINNTKTQHHLHNLKMTSFKPTFNKTKLGDIPQHT